jgi:hypothetical protein
LALGFRATAVNQFFNDVFIIIKLDLVGYAEVRPKVRDMDFIFYNAIFQVKGARLQLGVTPAARPLPAAAAHVIRY